MRLWIHICLLICMCSCTDLEEGLTTTSSEDITYELLMDYNKEHGYYVKKNLIDYFKMVALGSEFGDQFQISKKWVGPMKIFIDGSPRQSHIDELGLIIEEINRYATDGFYIKIVNESESANYHIFFGNKTDYKDRYQTVPELVDSNDGLFTVYSNQEFEITNGHMYVNLSVVSMEEQLHILREELTQSLGLANDIKYYNNSIFYDKPSRVMTYSAHDIEVIRLLYHPKFISGLHESSVQSALETILGIN